MQKPAGWIKGICICLGGLLGMMALITVVTISVFIAAAVNALAVFLLLKGPNKLKT